jgi:hypothetical protein
MMNLQGRSGFGKFPAGNYLNEFEWRQPAQE